MVSWPTGHRWEDYDVSILNVNRNRLGSLENVHKLRYDRTLYGQFGSKLTFSLDKTDDWAQILLERQLHYVQVRRDGERTFGGYQVKIDRSDSVENAEKWIDFEFVPLSFLLHWRIIPIKTCGEITARVDDAFKYIVRRTHGPLAAITPVYSVNRVMPGFQVAADTSQYPNNETIQSRPGDAYEFIQQRAVRYKVDWDIYFDANYQPTFRTWYPRRGADRTEDNPARRPIVFTDEQGYFVAQRYGWDTADLKTCVYDRTGAAEEIAGITRRTNWGLREFTQDTGRTEEMEVALAMRDMAEFYTLEQFVERETQQWREHFKTGDEVTWNSMRLGYGPHNDTICKVTAEIDEDGFEHLTVTFGDPEPDLMDKLRGGGRGRRRPDYDAPTVWHIFGDAGTNVDPDADNAIGVVGDGATVASNEDVANNQVVLSTIAAGLPYAVPALTFGAAHAAGAADSVIRSDAVVALGITCPDANTVYPLPAGPNRWTLTSGGGTVTITGAVANQINFEVAPAALPYAVPAIVFGAAHGAGANDNVIRNDATIALGITCDDANTVYPDAADNNEWDILGGTGCQTVGAVANTVTLDTVWVRADLRTGGGGVTGLHPTDMAGGFTEPVLIGVGNTDEANWINVGQNTKLDVAGLVRVARSIYATANSLALWGMTAGVPIVHIVDETAAVGGAGGGACILNVFDAATPRAQFDTAIANPSFVHGIFEIQDAAGAISATLNGVTGVVTLNVQRVAAGDFSVLSSVVGVTILGTDANTRDLILNNVTHLWPAADAVGALLSDGAGTLSWGLAPPAAHNLLSASHGDTAAANVVDGDVIIGNVAPAWSRLAIAVPGAGLRNLLGVDNAELRPSWKGLFDAVVPDTIQCDDAAAAGAAMVAARRDHTHGIVCAAPVDIANANAEGVATSFARSDHAHNHPAGLGVNLHHNEIHVVNSTGPHAEAGLTIGHVLRASGAAAFSFAQLQHGDLGGVGVNDHHAEVHVVNSAGPHAEAGLTIGHVLRASGAAAFSFAQLQHADLGGVGANDHHAEVHVVNSTGPHAEAGLTIGHVLRASGAAAFSFGALIATDLPAHNVLSAQHGDTLTANVVDGDVIIGNVTPKWSRLAIAIPGAGTRNVLGIDNAELRPSWKTAVYSVALTLPGEFNVAGSPITGTGTLAGTWVNQAANLVFSGPAAGAPAVPTFRALVAADIVGISDPGTCTVATGNAVGPPHTHAITTSNDVSGGGASILACTAGGGLTLNELFVHTGNIHLYHGSDIVLSSAAPGVEKGRWDGATGNITLADGASIGNIGGAGPVVTWDDTNNRLTVTGAHLRVGYDTDLASYFGRAAVGYSGFGDVASFAHLDNNTINNYALVQTAAGSTMINAATGQTIQFFINGVTFMARMTGTTVDILNSVDFNVYDGALGNLMASIDGATGQINTVDDLIVGDGETAGTRGIYAWADGSTALVTWTFGGDAIFQGTDSVIIRGVAGGSTITFSPVNAAEVVVSQGAMYPSDTNATTLGTATPKRWSNVYSVLGNYSGQVTVSVGIGTAPFAITSTTAVANLNVDMTDGFHATQAATNDRIVVRNGANIAMAAGGTVDGVDISVHPHNVTGGATGNASPSLSGTTDTWTVQGAASYGIGHNPVRDLGGVVRYLYIADDAVGTNARWEQCCIGTADHTHEGDNASGKGYADLIVDAHSHGFGTLSTGAPV